MPAPSSAVEFLELVKKCGLVTPESYTQVTEATLPPDPSQAAGVFVKRGWLTTFQAKQLLAGRYRGFRMGAYIVREQLGQGGMGIVYLAEHEQLRRRVALKVLTGPATETKNVTLERFLREARAAAALDHPNIVRIHDVGQHGQVHYLVMEYVEGKTFDDMITSSGPVSAGRAVGYVAQAAAGLQHAHEKGFIHRDIKPGNLMLLADGSVKILDMGLARSFENPNDKLTEQFDAGAVVGTADFISPEQALNDPNIDHRADIYSLGATFYALVTGQPPFTGNTTQKLMQHQMREAPPLISVDKTFPPDLSDVIAKMMAKQPHKRYESMAEVIEALTPWMPDATAAMAGMGRTSTDTLRRSAGRAYSQSQAKTSIPKWAIYSLAGLVVALVLGIAIWAMPDSKSEKDQKATALAKEQQPTPQPAQKNTSTPKNGTGQPKNSNTKPPTTNPPTTPGAARPAGQSVYKFVASEFPAFRAKYRGQSTFEGSTPAIPNGLTIHCWKPESEGEFTRTTISGKPAFGIANLNDGKTAQLRIDLEPKGLAALTPGHQYILRVEYLTDGEATGQLAIQGKDFAWIKGIDLGPTGGTWKTITATVDKDAEHPLQFGIDAKGEPNSGMLYIHTFEIIDPPGSSNAGPTRSAYKLNLATAKSYLARVICEGTEPDIKNRVVSQTGDGLPAKWEYRVWRPGATAEFLVSDETGTQALGIRTVDGKAGGMLVFPEVSSPEPRCSVTFDYKSSKPNAPFAVKYRPLGDNAAPTYSVRKLTAGNAWTTVTIPIDQKAATTGRIEIQLDDDEPDATLWLKNVSVQVPSGGSAVGEEKVVFQFDASQVVDFRARKVKQTVTSGSMASFPAGVGLTCWKDDSEGEFWRGDHKGVAVLGIASITDGDLVTAQLGVELESAAGVSLKEGKKYKLVVTYATTGTGYGNMYFQFTDYTSIAAQRELPNTGGEWKTVESPITRGDKSVRFLVDIKGSGLENALLIRSVKVVEE